MSDLIFGPLFGLLEQRSDALNDDKYWTTVKYSTTSSRPTSKVGSDFESRTEDANPG